MSKANDYNAANFKIQYFIRWHDVHLFIVGKNDIESNRNSHKRTNLSCLYQLNIPVPKTNERRAPQK